MVRAVRPHVVEAIVRTMFATDPEPALASVDAPVAALVALGIGRQRRAPRGAAPVRRGARRRRVGRRSGSRGTRASAHNLMRYRPAEVTAAILEAADGADA